MEMASISDLSLESLLHLVDGYLDSSTYGAIHDEIVDRAYKDHSLYETIRKYYSVTIELCLRAIFDNNVHLIKKMMPDIESDREFLAVKAANLDRREIVETILATGISNIRDISIEATRSGHLDLVRYLTTVYTDYDCLARVAAHAGHWEIVNEMLKKGAIDYDGITSASRNKEIIAKILASRYNL